MPWNDLLNLSLIGTDRRSPSPELLAWLERQGLDTGMDDAELILAAAAMLGPMKKGALQWPKWEGTLPKAPTVKGTLISGRAFGMLQKILRGKYRPALPEFVRLMDQYGFSLPPESLPGLLDQTLVDPELWKWIEPALGERGKWLCEHHPEWNKLLQTDEKESPETDWGEVFFPANRLLLERDEAYSILLRSTEPWPMPVSREVVEGLQAYLAETSGFDWGSWHYKELLKKAAYHSDPHLLTDFQKGWATERRAWGMWEQEVEQFLEVMLFRRHLHDAFLHTEDHE